jgi:hypothetical protein
MERVAARQAMKGRGIQAKNEFSYEALFTGTEWNEMYEGWTMPELSQLGRKYDPSPAIRHPKHLLPPIYGTTKSDRHAWKV